MYLEALSMNNDYYWCQYWLLRLKYEKADEFARNESTSDFINPEHPGSKVLSIKNNIKEKHRKL